jgi:prepilin peptidase CpaA
MQGGLSWILILALGGALAWACVGDWRSRTISNRLNAAIALLAIPYWWAAGLALWPGVAIQLGLAAAVFLIFALAFRAGMMGGGDVKLLAALSLWLPAGALATLLVVMSIAGGLLTVAMLAAHRAKKAETPLEIPYGIAIACGGYWVIGERIFNQFV